MIYFDVISNYHNFRSMIPISEISRELDEMREDIITKTSEISRQFSVVDQYIPSQPDGKLYVEKKGSPIYNSSLLVGLIGVIKLFNCNQAKLICVPSFR